MPIEVEAIFAFEALGSAACPCGNPIPDNATLENQYTDVATVQNGFYEEKLTQTFRCNSCGRNHHRSVIVRREAAPEGTPCQASP